MYATAQKVLERRVEFRGNTHIAPASDALHLAEEGHVRVPVVGVLVVVLAELAEGGPVGLHHVGVVQEAPLLLGTLLAAVGRAAADGLGAGEGRAGHLLAVHLSGRALEPE